jgi:hypothetical protein
LAGAGWFKNAVACELFPPTTYDGTSTIGYGAVVAHTSTNVKLLEGFV